MMDCPLPDEDINGLMTQGNPNIYAASSTCSIDIAYLNPAVFTPNSTAARSLIDFRFIVKFAALALGTT